MPPHFIIDRYFSEQSSCKDVALQAFCWITGAVAAAQVSARVAASLKLMSQRRRMSACDARLSPVGARHLDFLFCHKLWRPGESSYDSRDP